MALTTDERTRPLGNTVVEDKHQGFQYYRGSYPEAFDAYYRFTIVRNPFDRLVSAWQWRTRIVGDLSCDLAEFARSRPDGWRYVVKFALDGVPIRDALARFDYIGRFERLEETYAHLCSTLGLDCRQIPRTNQTGFGDYRKYYDTETVDFVYERYRDDIELFGYEF